MDEQEFVGMFKLVAAGVVLFWVAVLVVAVLVLKHFGIL